MVLLVPAWDILATGISFCIVLPAEMIQLLVNDRYVRG
jgi:hypothetical protein